MFSAVTVLERVLRVEKAGTRVALVANDQIEQLERQSATYCAYAIREQSGREGRNQIVVVKVLQQRRIRLHHLKMIIYLYEKVTRRKINNFNSVIYSLPSIGSAIRS